MVLEIIIVLVALVLGLVALRQRRQYAGVKVPPTVEGWIPFIGVGINFAMNPLGYTRKLYKEKGEIFTMRIFGKRMTFLVGKDAHVPFFSKGDKELSQDEPYRFSVPIFGEKVVYDAPLPIRTQQLRMVKNSLTSSALASYVSKIIVETENYFDEKWGNEGEVDLRDALSELIILTASSCLMGEEIRATLHDKVAQLFQTLDEGLTPISVFFPYLPIPAHKRRDKAREDMMNLFAGIIKQRKEHPEVKHNDVLQEFMDAKYRSGRGNTEREITGMMIALLFAGQHTSSVTSTWTGLLVLNQKEKFMNRILEEQEEALSESDGKLTYESLSKMKFLHNCIKEALRMYPPLIFVMRTVLEPFTYKDYYVPKGDTLFVSPALSMRLEDSFTKCDTYDPDRFSDARAEDLKSKYTYLGFGAGRHGCMGEQFAYVQIKTIWSVLFRKFEMELAGPLPEPDYKAMVVGPKHPCTIRYKRKVQK